MVLIVNTYNDDCDNWEQCDDTKYLYKWSDVVKMIHCDGTEKDKIANGTDWECIWTILRNSVMALNMNACNMYG